MFFTQIQNFNIKKIVSFSRIFVYLAGRKYLCKLAFIRGLEKEEIKC